MQETKESEFHERSNKKPNPENQTFECNICLDVAENPVITYCGHLYCWPCIFQWIKDQSERPCPVCKSLVSKDKIIPLYGRGKEQKDPRTQTEIPSRPTGQRTEAPQTPHGHMHWNYNYPPFMEPAQPVHVDTAFYAGFGLFPALFGLQFQYQYEAQGVPHTPQDAQLDNQFLSRMLAIVGLLLIFCILSTLSEHRLKRTDEICKEVCISQVQLGREVIFVFFVFFAIETSLAGNLVIITSPLSVSTILWVRTISIAIFFISALAV